MGSRNGIKERGTLLAEGFNKAGTRLFPRSQNGNYVPGMRNVV
uniref:Uncharacterized protein n=1 Tax=Arundo donax TaxID=35708 RepID=A0A0A9FTQ0_ARUDO